MQNRILILILEHQTSNSTETNYFNVLINNFFNSKSDCNNTLFNNKKTSSVDFKVIKNEKCLKLVYWKNELEEHIKFTKPNIIYGIIDNDNEQLKNLAKENFQKICGLIDSCYENERIFLTPPENLAFEYFLLLHIGEKGKIPLNKKLVNEKLKTYFNGKDIRKIKTDKNIFDNLLNKGTERLFINVEQHQNEHNYKRFVNNIFLKPDQKK